MERLLLVLLGFIAGEFVLYWLVSRGYDRLVQRGAAPPRRSVKRTLVAVSLLLPAAYAAVALFGVLAAAMLPGISLPRLAGAPPGPITGPAPEFTTPTLLPDETPAPDLATPTTEEAPGKSLLTPAPTSIWPPSADIMGDIPAGKIVYTCQVFKTGFRDQICIMNSDGSGYRRLTPDDNWDHNFPSLAPDGRSVIFVAREPDGESQIFEMDLESGDMVQLTENSQVPSAPEISPDGRMIVFNRLAEEANTIWVMERDGSNERMLFGPPRGHGWDPVWSPDGSRILFASDREVGVQLFTMDLEGNDVRQLTDLRLMRGRSDWSPDGTALATYIGQSWLREIVVMDSDGSNPRIITSGGNNLAPSFSPNGQWLVFTSYRDNYRDELGCEIYIMRRDGALITRLTNNDICDWQPRWGP